MKKVYLVIVSVGLGAAVNAQTTLTFDGSNNYKHFGESPSFAISGDLTVEAKSKATRIIDYSPMISNLMENESGNYQGYWLGIDTSGFALFNIGCSSPDQPGYDVLGTSVIDDEKWHHISGVVNSSGPSPTAMIYVDGVLENTIPIPNALILSPGTFYIGTDTWYYFHLGEVDDVRLWNRALSSSEISRDFNRSLNGNENGLVALYQFGLGSGKYKQFVHSEWDNMKAIKQKLRDTKKDMLEAEKDAKQAERDREQTEKENELLEKSQIIIALVAFSMVLLTMFLRYRAVQSKKVILKQAQLEAAEQEQEILALTVKEENRNVQALSLELLVKQDFSKSLFQELNKYESLSNSEKNSIEIFIQNELDVKSTRALLQDKMGGLSGDFYNLLKRDHAELSENDIKLAAMIVLKMTNKEIAISKNITAASVRITKVRLKKKLAISAEIDLFEYLNKFL